MAPVAPAPNNDMVIVDPIGLQLLRDKGPHAAKGVSIAIYEFIGIAADTRFPKEVIEGVRLTGQAYLHMYRVRDGTIVPVIHAAGADLRKPPLVGAQEAGIVRILCAVYHSILEEFADTDYSRLRFPPMISGTFQHGVNPKLPTLKLPSKWPPPSCQP